MLTVTRFHDFSMGHRICKHEHACAQLHGHNYRVHFTCSAPNLDAVGRVIDFGVIKALLCQWLEDNWDHRMVLSEEDPWAPRLKEIDDSVVLVDFDPTAENLAAFLFDLGNELLPSPITMVSVRVEETRKCSAEAT
jgi:6-pyruvoyltetrahydropterin/6-carboxytetrahydropterin synthase